MLRWMAAIGTVRQCSGAEQARSAPHLGPQVHVVVRLRSCKHSRGSKHRTVCACQQSNAACGCTHLSPSLPAHPRTLSTCV